LARGSEGSGVQVRLEADQSPWADIQYRSFYHRGVGLHERDGLVLVKVLLVGIIQPAEGGSLAVEDLLPAMLFTPGVQALGVNAFLLVVVEVVLDTMLVQPGAGFLHGVTGLDAVQGNHRYAGSGEGEWCSRQTAGRDGAECRGPWPGAQGDQTAGCCS